MELISNLVKWLSQSVLITLIMFCWLCPDRGTFLPNSGMIPNQASIEGGGLTPPPPPHKDLHVTIWKLPIKPWRHWFEDQCPHHCHHPLQDLLDQREGLGGTCRDLACLYHVGTRLGHPTGLVQIYDLYIPWAASSTAMLDLVTEKAMFSNCARTWVLALIQHSNAYFETVPFIVSSALQRCSSSTMLL
jgi:hypothetical protein